MVYCIYNYGHFGCFFCTVEFANVYAAFLEINVQLKDLSFV